MSNIEIVTIPYQSDIFLAPQKIHGNPRESTGDIQVSAVQCMRKSTDGIRSYQ